MKDGAVDRKGVDVLQAAVALHPIAARPPACLHKRCDRDEQLAECKRRAQEAIR